MNSKKYQIVALIGKSGAGKDAIQSATCKAHPNVFNKIISCTTRPIRENEQDGIHYSFVSLEDFTRKMLSGDMIEATEFRGWFYGTLISSLAPDKINIGVFNPTGVEALLEDSRLEVMVIYVDVDDKTRLMRCLNREDNPNCHEICRRFLTDDEDFATIDFGYTVVDNPDFGNLDLLTIAETSYEDFSYMWERVNKDSTFESAAFWGKEKKRNDDLIEFEDKND
jgi:guanylate kinase